MSEIHEPWHAIMEWHQHAGVKNIVLFGTGYGISFSQEASWFRYGNVSPLWTKRYLSPLLAFNFFPGVNIEQQECRVKFWIFLGESFGHSYMLIEFSRHLCA